MTTLPQVKRVLNFVKAWDATHDDSEKEHVAGVMVDGDRITLTFNDLRALVGIVAGVKNVEGMAAVSAVILNYEAVNRRQRESIDRLLQRIDDLEGRGYAEG